MKKGIIGTITLISAMLIVLCLATMVSAAGITADVNDQAAHRGEEVVFTATLSNAVTVRSGAVSLEYDKNVLQLVSGEWNISGTTLSTFKMDTEKGAFAYSAATEISGTIFTAKFKILDSAAFGNADVALTVQLRDADKNDMTVVNQSGVLTVKCKHSFTAQTVADKYLKASATCTSKAVYFKSCSFCGEKGTDTFEIGNALNHLWSTTYSTSGAGHYRTCTRQECGISEDAVPHSGGTKTCTTLAICDVCNNVYGNTLPHNYEDGIWKSDTLGHWKKCKDCSAEDTANKIGHNATDDNNCETAVYCTACNYMTVAAQSHNLTVGESKDANDHIMECTNIGCDYAEDAAHNFNKKVESADYLKNNADCTTAKTYYYSCECGHKGSTTFTVGTITDHDFEWVIDIPADKQNTGLKHKECTVCHTKRNEGTVIDKLACDHAAATKTNQVDADHHNTGKKAYWYCAECNKYFSDEACLLEIADIGAYGIIAKVDHEFGIAWEKDANNHWHECTCGDKTDVTAHTYNQEVVNADYLKDVATCTTAAVYYKSCICGAKGTETFTNDEALDHNYEWVIDEPASKTQTGLKHEDCTRCDAVRNEDTVIPVLTCDHATATKTNQVDADHHNTGKKAYWYCAECNKYFSDEACLLEISDVNTYGIIAKVDHEFGTTWEKDTNNHWHECTCGDKTDVTAHTYNQEVVNELYKKSNATCTDAAVYYKSCVCGAKGTETFTSGTELGHDFEWVVDTPADKHNTGLKHEECIVCHTKRNEGTVIDKLACDHAAATKTNQVDADHHNAGKKAYWYCAECNKYFSDEACLLEIADIGAYGIISKVEHEFGTTWESDANNHWHECTCGDKTDVTAHTYNQEVASELYKKDSAICTTPATYYKSCICGAKGTETFTSGTTLVHDLEHHDAKTPTCTEIGWNAYDTCKRDGCEYTTYVELEALGHDFSVDKHDADNHWQKCSRCDEIDGKEAHNGGTATCTTKAKCSICDVEYGEYAPHSYETEWSKNKDKHWQECVCGDKTNLAEHKYGNDNICDDCGYENVAQGGTDQPGTNETPDNDNNTVVIVVAVSVVAIGGIGCAAWVFIFKKKRF